MNQKLLDYLNKQIYQKIMSAAISTSINNLVLSEKSQQLDALKLFLTSKLDDADEICSMIDDFSSLSPESKVKIKISKTSKSPSKNKAEKKKRRKSYYSHYMSVRLKAYSEEHKGDKVDRGERIKFCTAEYNKHKETPEFKNLKDEWDAKTSSGSDENEVDKFKKPETPPKKAKAPPKKVKKPTKKQVEPDVSDSDDEDEIVPKNSSKQIDSDDDSDNDDDTGKAKISPIESDDDSDDSDDESI